MDQTTVDRMFTFAKVLVKDIGEILHVEFTGERAGVLINRFRLFYWPQGSTQGSTDVLDEICLMYLSWCGPGVFDRYWFCSTSERRGRSSKENLCSFTSKREVVEEATRDLQRAEVTLSIRENHVVRTSKGAKIGIVADIYVRSKGEVTDRL